MLNLWISSIWHDPVNHLQSSWRLCWDCKQTRFNYANYSTKLVKRNQKLHNPDSPLLIGDVKDSDVVKEISEPSYIDTQQKLL